MVRFLPVPARVALRTEEGPCWLVDAGPNGAALTEDDADGRSERPAAVVSGRASDLLLTLHRRVPVDRVRVDGDRAVATDLFAWPSLG